MENYYSDKICRWCGNTYFGYRSSKYCEACRKVAKAQKEMDRYRSDPEYKEQRKASLKLYASRNRDKRRTYEKDYRAANRQKMVEYQKQWVKRNPEKYKSKVRKRNLAKFGLSIKQYDDLLQRQGGVCAICKQPCKTGRRLAVDHCHDTGEVRGLLCGQCNRGLGYFYDNKDTLKNAYEYL